MTVLTKGWALGHQQAKLHPLLGLQCPTDVSCTTSRCSTRTALLRGALTFQAMLRTGALELLEELPGSRFEVFLLPRVFSCLPYCEGWQLSEIVSSTPLLRGVKMKVTAPLLSLFRAVSAHVGTMLFRTCVCVRPLVQWGCADMLPTHTPELKPAPLSCGRNAIQPLSAASAYHVEFPSTILKELKANPASLRGFLQRSAVFAVPSRQVASCSLPRCLKMTCEGRFVETPSDLVGEVMRPESATVSHIRLSCPRTAR